MGWLRVLFGSKERETEEPEKETDRITDSKVIDFLRDEIQAGETAHSKLTCEYCGHRLLFQDMGDHYNLWCMNRMCFESEMHNVYKEDL